MAPYNRELTTALFILLRHAPFATPFPWDEEEDCALTEKEQACDYIKFRLQNERYESFVLFCIAKYVVKLRNHASSVVIVIIYLKIAVFDNFQEPVFECRIKQNQNTTFC